MSPVEQKLLLLKGEAALAEVLHAFLSQVTGWIQEVSAAEPPRRILDLGSGTGTGALALLRRFPAADVIAVDRSADLLHHLDDRARDLGVAARVRTVQADLDAARPALDTVNLVWASASLHHLADPDRVLPKIFATLRPGGLLGVIELSSFPQFLPDDPGLGRPGLEARCHAALAGAHAREVPHLGSDWGSQLSRAGFTVEAERSFALHRAPLGPPSTGRYAHASLRRTRAHLDGRISPDDLAALDALLDTDPPRAAADALIRPTVPRWHTTRSWRTACAPCLPGKSSPSRGCSGAWRS